MPDHADAPPPGADPEPGPATDLDLILASDLFDPDWYGAAHPDVALRGANPARHYLRFGGLLGRPAGPRFGPATHPEVHAEAARRRVNPLTLFIRESRG